MEIIRRGLWVGVKNLAVLLVGLWLLGTVSFLWVAVAGGDLGGIYTGGLPPGAREEARRELQLEQPSLPRAYAAYWANLLTGRWGYSVLYYPRTVVDVLGERLPRSLLLLGGALLAGLGLGRALSRLLNHPRPGLSLTARFGALGLATLPLPLAVLLPDHVLGYRLGWFPYGQTLDPLLWRDFPDASVNGVLLRLGLSLVLGLGLGGLLAALARRVPLPLPLLLRTGAPPLGLVVGTLLGGLLFLGERLPLGADLLRHLALPWLTLTLYAGAGYALLLRSDFFPGGGRAHGLGSWALYLAWVLALLPAVEATYHWLGLGPLLSRALLAADLPLLQGLSFTLIGLLALGVLAYKIQEELRPEPGRWRWRWGDRVGPAREAKGAAGRDRFRRAAFRVGFLVLLSLGIAGALHPWLLETVWDPRVYDPRQGTDARFPPPAPPSALHPLGTDRNGRDVLSGLLYSVRITLFPAAVQGAGAALLALGIWGGARLLQRAQTLALARLAPGIAIIAYLPLAVPFLFAGRTAVLRWPLPPWTWWALVGLPWAFHALPLRPGIERVSVGNGDGNAIGSGDGRRSPRRRWARALVLVLSVVCYASGAILLRPTLRLPQGTALEPWVLQDPLREWWLFWPAMAVLWLLPFVVFALGWALRLWARGPSET